MDANIEMFRNDTEGDDNTSSKDLEDMKKRLKEIEEEAGALREMQAKVKKEMGSVQGALFFLVQGLFDTSVDSEFVGKEIVSCINLATDGIDVVLLVFSVSSRFSKEEEAAISSLLALFGTNILDYIILVFAGGDLLDRDNKTLEGYLYDCPQSLKELLCLCGIRCILFDNRTNDQSKRANQVDRLVSLVNMVSKEKNGQSYTNEIFIELKVELKIKETTLRFKQLLEEERAARIKAEESVILVQFVSHLNNVI
uniref:immune-associated nucleotide-binding protein 9-like n=1 Tax=Erigeron canadensis TaxID=72917 RepID=UPI001CB9A400|nr:immune-associated nucleotide-binding protein 9-like [Erigeron canadensis]